MEDLGGVEPLARGLKARCPTASGLNAPGPLSARAAARRPLLMIVIMVILQRRIKPRSSGYRPGALLLSYETISNCGFAPNRCTGRAVTITFVNARFRLMRIGL